MPNIDWTWMLIGLFVGWLGVPLVLGILNSKRKTATTAAQ